jgi:serine/threonine protein kinase
METIETCINTLTRRGLLQPADGRALRERWQQSAGSHAADVDRFLQWLVSRQALTEFQAGFIARGHVDQLFLGPYKIVERIGKGRMAGIYLAVHEAGPTVAVKILPGSKARDPETLARFQREARLAQRLKHPNIVRTFQSGVANGFHFIAMEYLEGESLEEVFHRRGPLPPPEAVRLVHQTLVGLEHLHQEGMVHRDLKPGNLILVGGQPDTTLNATIKIVDIGLGKALFEEGRPTGDLTNEGDILGTPEYMSPEQARDPRNADIRSDIYSLGCVLYHALTGRPPFVEPSPVRLLVAHAKETPRPARSLNPAVPEGLDQILEWMLKKDPAGRYPTPARAAAALQVYLVAGAEPARPENDPRMNRYFAWLAEQTQEDALPAASRLPAKPAAVPVPVVEKNPC